MHVHDIVVTLTGYMSSEKSNKLNPRRAQLQPCWRENKNTAKAAPRHVVVYRRPPQDENNQSCRHRYLNSSLPRISFNFIQLVHPRTSSLPDEHPESFIIRHKLQSALISLVFRPSLRLDLERHLLLDLGNGQTWVQTLGASSGTVKDGVASVQTH